MMILRDDQRKAMFAQLNGCARSNISQDIRRCSPEVSKSHTFAKCADFAKLNRPGVSLFPLETVFKPSEYSGIVVSGVKDVDISSPPISDVPTWVSSSDIPQLQESSSSISDLDYLEQYAKTVKPVDSSIVIGEDRSDVLKDIDDTLLQYASTIEPEKKLVGAIKVDDEYKGEPIDLIVRSGKKRLNRMDEVFNLQSREPISRINIKEFDGKLSININGKTKTIDIPVNDPIVRNNLRWKTIDKLHGGYRLNENDLSVYEIERLEELFEDAV